MCGIVGYVGNREANEIVYKGKIASGFERKIFTLGVKS
jgi:hypothetical protein